MQISKERLLNELTIDIKKRDKQNWKLYIPFVIAFTWAMLLFIAPMLEPPGTIYLGNNGKVSVPDNTPYIDEHIKNPLAHAVYISGDYMCHQHSNRSFFIMGNQMPYCARCTGIFLGLGIGFLIAALFKVRVGFGFYFLTIIPLGLDGFIQLITPYESTNFMRILTGLFVGIYSAMLFIYVYEYDPHAHEPAPR